MKVLQVHTHCNASLVHPVLILNDLSEVYPEKDTSEIST